MHRRLVDRRAPEDFERVGGAFGVSNAVPPLGLHRVALRRGGVLLAQVGFQARCSLFRSASSRFASTIASPPDNCRHRSRRPLPGRPKFTNAVCNPYGSDARSG